jgi:hypothetical protein
MNRKVSVRGFAFLGRLTIRLACQAKKQKECGGGCY